MDDLITVLKDELVAAIDFEQVRIKGEDRLLSIPESLITDSTKGKVSERRDISNRRLKLLKNALQAVILLIDDEYPERNPEICANDNIAELNEILETLKLILGDFEQVPIGLVTISEEIKV